MSRPLRSWGGQALRIALPGLNVQLQGLTEQQSAALSLSYARFIDADLRDAETTCIRCDAVHLSRSPTLPIAELSCAGQYALRQCRRGGEIALTGINFEGGFAPLDAHRPAWIGVADEHELPLPNVIENFLRVLVAHRALALGGVVLHSAGFALGDHGYVFAGYSGAGKTTLTRKAHSHGAQVLSDDINLLLPDQGRYQAHAVPFTGEFGRTLSTGLSGKAYPLACLILLEQGERLETMSVSAVTAVSRLLANCPFVNTDGEETAALFDVLTALVARVPVVRLRCRRDDPLDAILATIDTSIGNANT